MATRFHRTASTIVRPTLPPWPPRYRTDAAVIAALREIERHDHDLARFGDRDATARRLIEDALTRNAFGTASIEGNPLSLEEVESLLVRDPTAPMPTSPDEREILNYASLMRDLPRLRMPHTVQDVERLHDRLFRRVLRDRGHLKRTPNFVARRETGEIVYVPTAPGSTRAELQASLDWVREAPENPVVRAGVFFHEFQSIHPFTDGNGRLGRALTTIFLWSQGYRGVRFALIDYAFNQDRTAYYAALSAARAGGWDRTPWLEYVTGVLHDAFREAVGRFLFRERLPARLNDRQVRVAEWFARQARASRSRRVKFNDVHSAFPHVPRRTLQLDLATLVKRGVAERQGERKATTYRLGTAYVPDRRAR